MAAPKELVYNFLKSKGLPPNAIYGIMGNLMLESGFSTTAQNPKSGAYGLAQWLGGRQQELNNYAYSAGLSPDNIYVQLDFLWHELTTSYSSTLDQLKTAGSPADAARIFEAGYEISGGQMLQARINYAEQFAGGGGPDGASGGGNGPTPVPESAGAKMTEADYTGVDSLGKLLSTIPELKKLVDEAVAGNWSQDKFENEVADSDWYKTHGETARSILIEQANDPATFQRNLDNTEASITNIARQNGWSTINADTLRTIATNAMMSGNDSNQQWLTHAIGQFQKYSNISSLSSLSGGMAQTTQQLQQLAGQYGYTWNVPYVAQQAADILMGNTTIDTYKRRLMSWAKSAFPSLAKEIDAGQTVSDLAQPYVTSMSNLLEVDPNTLSVYTPQIRKAMQGTYDPTTKAQASTPLWQFEQQVRQDPRWQFTDNAKQTVASALVHIGNDFGFGV